jgi:threonine aldolase
MMSTAKTRRRYVGRNELPRCSVRKPPCLSPQIAVRLHTQPGQEVILEERSHMFNMEMAGMAVISGVLAHPLQCLDGIMALGAIREALS